MVQRRQMSSLQCKELTDVKQFFKRLRTVIVPCSKTESNKTSSLISVKKRFMSYGCQECFYIQPFVLTCIKKYWFPGNNCNENDMLTLIQVLIVLYKVIIYMYIDGHESKPAISIFRIFIIFSKITKLYPLQLHIEFPNV